MGNSHSAQHNFHHHHPHDPRGYRPYHAHHHHHGEVAYPPDDPRWNVHSFPRDMHRRGPPLSMQQHHHHQQMHRELAPENKVLPKVLGPPPKLRATNNGAILNQGGTISGRKISQSQVVAPVKAYKAKHEKGSPASRLSANRFGGSEPDLRAPSNFRAPQAPLMMASHQKPSSAKVNANAAAAALANRKKYKAPPPPPAHKQESESPSDTSGWEDTGSAAPKKTRLFKTRAQTSNGPNSPAPSNDARRSEESSSSKPRAQMNAAASAFLAKRSVSSPEFQLELVKAAQQRHKERQAKQQAPAAEVLKKATAAEPHNKGSPTPAGPRHAPVGRESSGEHREVKENHRSSRPRSPVVEKSAKKPKPVPAQPPKTFYFGMDMSRETAAEEDEVDRFAARLRNPELRRKRSSSGSGGSYSEEEILQNDGDINLQLRPVLPKKTPDIPRFSPTAAWRQLLANDLIDDQDDENRGRRNRSASPILRETSGTAALLEERIVQCYSQRAPLVVRGSVATQEKSGDSGISGDASPGPGQNMLDSPDPPPVAPSRLRKHHSPVTRQWTPEQDLDESSSDEEHVKGNAARGPPSRRAISEERPGEPVLKAERGRSSGRVTPPKFTRRSHMFSLSLPRPDQLQSAAGRANEEFDSPLESPNENLATFHSLKKFKKSVSGALGSAFQNKYHSQQQLSLDENWYLSRSAPNSLDSVGDAPVWPQRSQVPPDEGVCWQSPNDSSSPDQYEEDDSDEVTKVGSKPLSHIASGSHIMYLPEYDSRRCVMPRIKSRQLHAGQRSLSVDVLTHLSNQERDVVASNNNNSLLIVRQDRPQEMRELRPESPWEVPQQYQQERQDEPIVKALKSKLTGKAGKKFTFQSTIRQIERKRVADRLSKEAEMMEKQRRQEADAMRKVEEEFQKKRAREKATLKEQLRLFSMQDNEGPQSLPAISLEERVPQRSRPRAEPDGQAAVKQVAKKSIYKQIAQSIQEDEQQPKTKEPREYKDYVANPAKINSRFPSGERASPSPSSSSASSNTRRNVTHPAIICDIPKSSPSYLGPIFAESDLKMAPEVHNYRREFAKGALSGGGAAAAASRVPRAHLTPSPSPKEQDGGASRGQSQYNSFASLPPQQTSGSSASSGSSKLTSSGKVSGLQPFNAAKSKGYRPIGFKAAPSSGSPGAKAKAIQAVS